MAKATEKWENITVEEVRLVNKAVRAGVTLELDDQEARFLSFILGRIGGSPTDSARKYAERISNVLTRVGYAGWFASSETEQWTLKDNRAIYFTPKSLDVFKKEY